MALAGWLCVSAAGPLWAEAPPSAPSLLRVKVSRAGEVFIDRKPVTLTELTSLLLARREQGAAVVIYREGAMGPPTPEVEQVLQVLSATKVPLQSAEQAPSEWGDLRSFEIEVAPHQLRIAIAGDRPFLLGIGMGEGQEPFVYHQMLPDTAQRLRTLEMLISANRVIETPQNQSARSFQADALQTPSLHVRILYANDRTWRAWYPGQKAPGNIISLLADCQMLAKQIVPPEVFPKPQPAAPTPPAPPQPPAQGGS